MKVMIIEKYGRVPLKLADIPVLAIGNNDVLSEIVTASSKTVDYKITM